MRTLAGALLLPLAVGCAGSRSPLDDSDVDREELSGRPIACRPGPDCDAKWARARTWVERHSHVVPTAATDVLIETRAPEDSRDPSFTVRRMAALDGNAWIVLEAACSPGQVGAVVEHVRPHRPGHEEAPAPRRFTECSPPVPELRASFAEYVGRDAAAGE